MSRRNIGPLAVGYNSEIDEIDELTWDQYVQGFEDGNINQTWAYAAVVAGRHNMSHMVLKLNGDVVAIAEVRIKKLPIFNFGIAYVGWGPLWQRKGAEADIENFRQAVRALRNEYLCKRGLNLRLFPLVFEDDLHPLSTILAEEGFSLIGKETGDRTILMDLTPSLETLREGMARNWKRSLKHAESCGLAVMEGSGEVLVEEFIKIYDEMLSRKMIVESNTFNYFKQLQAQLPEQFKMRIMLCRSGEDICAGLVWSAIGKMGIELFAATSNIGTQSCGSHLLRWKLVEELKRQGVTIYNLNGINPAKNPGTYRFKSELARKHGRDVFYMGKFDANTSTLGYSIIQFADVLRAGRRKLRQRLMKTRITKSLASNQTIKQLD
jgi:lipid II:glycine glycyltransferase (peptidoglycan interpeptide bridge formation enzyme)